MKRTRSKLAGSVALAALTGTLLVIAGCTSSSTVSGPSTTGSAITGETGTAESHETTGAAISVPGGAAPTASYSSAQCPNPIYPQAPALDLGPEFECGYLTVPENRQNPGGRSIRIAVARVPATAPNPKPDPIVYLTGGPGGSGLLSAVQRVQQGWNSDRDVIFLDQRGTWKSDPLLACPEIDQFLADAVSLNTFDPATAAQSGASVRACRDRIVADGWSPADFTTTENAADIADLRVALGIDEWNLYGVSYGTDLAAQTLRDHPAGIRSVVLDSLVPAQDVLVEDFWPSAAHGFEVLFDDCAAQPACNSAYPNVRADFVSQVNQLATTPRTVSIANPATGQPADVVIDGFKLANLVATSSLIPGEIAPLPMIIDNLANGDGTLAAARLLASVPPSGVTGYGLALGVLCSEHIPFSSQQQLIDGGRKVLPEFPDAVLALAPQIPTIFGDCAQWDVPAADAAVRAPLHSQVPTLLVSGSMDAVTAPPNATTVAAGLPNAKVLEFPDSAHDVMIWSPQCGVSVMHSFLDDPANVDASCVAALQVPAFATG